ncbi:divalent-cation tolerance protein CutA [Desulfovibrio gilichinskyi]|uniref:Divalent cation tolerance protein n=1 Tax=Desulfovibrio gilichinskyi TaxID=1519643 RepID=A0A1X7C4K9_9BACT|nr:divalent-cation tolerance protein CutA [Desulfovibrio gilichinskyi]SME89883.1 divalent cation tolerance protein [Desulfovibrio gilichinskyi]
MDENLHITLIYITASDAEEARKIGCELLTRHFVACVNVIDKMESMYWWEGRLESSTEAILLVKTVPSLVGKVTETVKNMHSYDCPCIVAVESKEGNSEFFEWVESQTARAVY